MSIRIQHRGDGIMVPEYASYWHEGDIGDALRGRPRLVYDGDLGSNRARWFIRVIARASRCETREQRMRLLDDIGYHLRNLASGDHYDAASWTSEMDIPF